jgi:hypothetical protein
MNKLPDELVFEIYKFLPNYDMFNFYKINKRFSELFHKYKLMEYSLNRKHPVVYNIYDNYCYICNLTLSIICFNEEFKTIRCKHC